MPRDVSAAGDVVLSARPATAGELKPYGRLLSPGRSVRLGRRGGVVVAVAEEQPGPRRVTHLVRYPGARRLLLPLGDVPLLLVGLPLEAPAGLPPVAFRTPPGHGIVLEAGVWHAGPLPLEAGRVLEILETGGTLARMDRLPLRDLAGLEAARVMLPDEPGAPGPGLDLATPGAVRLAPELAGRLRLAFALHDAVDVGEAGPGLVDELRRLATSLRSTHAGTQDLATVPGARALAALWEGLGLGGAERPAPPLALLARVLAGRALPRGHALADALAAFSLRSLTVVLALDADRIGDALLLRPGRAGEHLLAPGGERRAVQGQPVLCDRGGPVATLGGPAERVQATRATRRVLAVLVLPPDVDEASADALLDGLGRDLGAHVRGRERARLVLP